MSLDFLKDVVEFKDFVRTLEHFREELPRLSLSGLTMSPRMDAAFPELLALFGGRQSARTIHFILAGLLVAFVLIHVFEVIVTGLWNNLRSMITGRYRVTRESVHE